METSSTHWTVFNPDELKLDHLTDAQMQEVFEITQEEDPVQEMRRSTGLTWVQEAWAWEDVYQTSRDQVVMESNQKRWTRLMELGVLVDPEEDTYEWEDLDQMP